MALVSTLERGVLLSQRVGAALSFAPPLITRIVVGMGFYLTGSGKLQHLDGVVEFFRSLGVPWPELQAPFVARLEYYGGLLIVVGLFTRPIAAALTGTMIVALATADKSDIITAFQYLFNQPVADDWSKVPTDVTAFAYLLLLTWLVIHGAGALSVDKLLGLGLKRAAAAEPPLRDEQRVAA